MSPGSVEDAWSDSRGDDVTGSPSFYAHSTSRIDKSDWQPLREHLLRAGNLAARHAEFFGGSRLAETCGLLHDLGKYTREFQLRLSGEFPRMDHATWGARIACERFGIIGQLLAYGIAGHHAGLANGKDGVARRALQDRLVSRPEHALLPEWEGEVALPAPDELALPAGFHVRKERAQFQQAFLGRMLFSCLVDADFVDTDEFYRRVEGRLPRNGGEQPTLVSLRERLNSYLSGFSETTETNRTRAQILEHVRAQAEFALGMD